MKYAISGKTTISKTLRYDVVIAGAGIAGLYAALNIDEGLSCIILAKDSIEASNSWLAQGGISAAISVDDDPAFHLEDTIKAGAGLCDMAAVKMLVDEAPSVIEDLVSLGVPFDLDEFGGLQLTREGGHKKNRIVHAGGDAIGREAVISLSRIISRKKNITLCGNSCVFDFLTDEDGVAGLVMRSENSEFVHIRSKAIVIATGGIGQLYASSTNPAVATGDGLAAAMRRGANLANMEFIQFHPTGLWAPEWGGRRFLISEAVRGEGGILLNGEGKRFMQNEHPLAELAPRDIVARSILTEMRRSGAEYVYLDITSRSESFLKNRFPTIYGECLGRGINIAHDRIPVCPVQHYLIGGIETDLDGRTNINGLYACGESANTGIHGGNRLASNSLLECLVFGRRTARHINKAWDRRNPGSFNAEASLDRREPRTMPEPQGPTLGAAGCAVTGNLVSRPASLLNHEAIREMIQQLMSVFCGVMRKASELAVALERVSSIRKELESVYDESNAYLETLSIATVAEVILTAALNRPKSVGAHYVD